MKDTTFLKKWLLPNFPYVLIFWFANKLGEAFRIAPGAGFQQKLLGFTRVLNKAMSNPLPSFNP